MGKRDSSVIDHIDMAAAPGIASALLGPLAPPGPGAVAPPAAAPPMSSVKTMQQLLNDIDHAKLDVENNAKTLEKIDTGRKKAVENRDRSVEGRTQVRGLAERVISLQKEMDVMTKDTDPTWPAKTFDKTKRNALKTLSNLGNKLNNVDKHLERSTGTMSITAPAPGTNVPPAATPVAATPAENPGVIGALFNRLPFGSSKKAASTTDIPAVTTTEAAPVVPKPVEPASDPAKPTTKEALPSEGEDESEEDDNDVVSAKQDEVVPPARRPAAPVDTPKAKAPAAVESEGDDDDSDDDDDDDNSATDYRELSQALEKGALVDGQDKDAPASGRRSRTPTTPSSRKGPPAIKIDSTRAPSPKPKKTVTPPVPSPSLRKKTPSPRRRTPASPTKKAAEDESDNDSYFEEDEEEEDAEEELRRLHGTGDHEPAESDHDVDEPEDDEPTAVNANVEELRRSKHPPGTQFRVIHSINGVQAGDLTIVTGEMLSLVEQRDKDDWWLFQNMANQQQGLVPINHIQLVPGPQSHRRRVKQTAPRTALADAFKANNNIPAGFISSDLAPLTQLEDYHLWRFLVPKMTESNLAFADLHWRPDNDQIHLQEVTYQKILTIKQCVKVPRVLGEQVRVLDRCIRVCLYDGFEIVSNIHTIRAFVWNKVTAKELTEDWFFAKSDLNSLTDEQAQLLIRSNRSESGQPLRLLIELSQFCESTVTQERSEIGCGWCMTLLDDDKPPLISDTKAFNVVLNGGHTDETNVLLDPQYKTLRSDGLTGKIDRLKRARIKFSLESRETDIDILFDNLPIQPLVVPINLVQTLVFFRHELAFRLHQRHHPTGLSTTPIDSIFLATLFQALAQPDLIHSLRRLYRSRKKRNLSSSASLQQQRAEFIRTYELFIYPLLQYRQLPPYDFHDRPALNERKKLIDAMIKRQLPARKTVPQDILSILLDPNLTDKWTPFTTDEVGFTLQRYAQNFPSNAVA